MIIGQIVLDLSKWPTEAILGAIAILGLIVLLVPVALKFAGLTGQQIADVLNLTMQFFINLVAEFRAQNKDK